MHDMLARDLTQLNLYERLGGAAGIRRIVDEAVAAHMRNPTIRARFLPYQEDPDRLAELKGQLASFMAAGAGGPGGYDGRSMVEAHRGMNIGAAEYMAATDDILGVLEDLGYDEPVRTEVLSILYGLKSEIIAV